MICPQPWRSLRFDPILDVERASLLLPLQRGSFQKDTSRSLPVQSTPGGAGPLLIAQPGKKTCFCETLL